MTIKALGRLALAVAASAGLGGTAGAVDVVALGAGNQLVVVDSATPGSVSRTVQVTGLGAGQTLLGLDARPAANGRVLYGVANNGQLYSINPMTGAASAVGGPLALQGTAFGIDFNPTVDRIRLISDTGQNLRINPDTGAATVDGPLNITVGGQPIVVSGNTAAAYTNNVAGATSTTLYVINTQTGLLQIQNPPNAGTLNVVGGLGGGAAGTVSGFDISLLGDVRATVVQNGVTRLFSVNLTTGAATLIGTFGTGAVAQGLAFLPFAFAANPGLTANQRAVAGTIDNFSSITPGFLPLLRTLDALPAAARADAFRQLGPGQFEILPEVVLETNEFVDGALRHHLGEARAVGADDERKLGGFLLATGRTGDFGSRGQRPEFDYGATGVIGGLDVRFGQSAVLGIAAGYDAADFSSNAITRKSRAKTKFVGGYAGFGFGPAHLDITGSYGDVEFDLRRNVAFGDFATRAETEADGRYYAGSAILGFGLDLGGFEIEPYGGARYADVRVGTFAEGTGLTDLAVARQSVESLQGIAGLRVGGDFRAGGARVRPAVRAEYRREFENDEARTITASFAGAGINTPFATTTTPFDDEYVVAGASLTVSGDAPISLLLDYTGQYAGDRDVHGAQVGFRFRF